MTRQRNSVISSRPPFETEVTEKGCISVIMKITVVILSDGLLAVRLIILFIEEQGVQLSYLGSTLLES